MEKPVSKAINYGVIAGIVSILFTILMFVMGAKYFSNPALLYGGGLVGFVVMITLMIMSANYRKKAEGHLSFQNAFREAFIPVVVGTLLSILVSIILFNFIDPEFGIKAEQGVKDVMVEFEDRMSEKQFERSMKQIEKMDEGFTIGGILKNSLTGIALYGAIGLLIAAIVRKKKVEIIEEA